MAQEEQDRLLLRYIQETVLAIFAEVAKSSPERADRLLAQIKVILDSFALEISDVLPRTLIEEYFGGVSAANTALAGIGIANLDGAPIIGGLIARPYQQPLHLEAIEVLIDDTMTDMGAAIKAARESSTTTVEQVLERAKGVLVQGQLSGAARATTKAEMMRAFREEGLTVFITSDNKKLPLDFYAMTVSRTKTRTAAVQGSINRYREQGHDLIQIIGNGDSCKQCSAFVGLVVSLDGKSRGYIQLGTNGVKLPPFHPNCNCGVILYDVAGKTPAEIRAAKYRGKTFSPERDRRTKAQREQYARTQAARRRANAEKLQFMRWQEALGAEAPKTLAAFRNMKRQNTFRFQELQSEYRSYAQLNRKR